MKAVVIYEVGGPEVLKLEDRPIPHLEAGKVLIQVKAFGLNRSEMFTRLGHSKGKVFFPRILGIECVGIVKECHSGNFSPGQQVAVVMGGLGRQFDGSYAEYTLVPEEIVIPFTSSLDWPTLGAIPEMCQTASGSLEQSLQLKAGETLLIRGGTSSVGITAAQLAKNKGCIVYSTTRSMSKANKLMDIGVDEIITDDGEIAPKIKALSPSGVDKVLELVGGNGIRDSLKCVKRGGIVCQTGYLSNQWRIDGFSPLGEIPSGVYLTSYQGGNADLPPNLLQQFIDQVEKGSLQIQIDQVFKLDQIVEAHSYMESNKASGKLVVVT
ncbi:MAG: NADPH:quinone reductase [Bacteroidetes bacterium]|nr:MAG: NADPH:quinone reductase [Bacteroidota bacterium]